MVCSIWEFVGSRVGLNEANQIKELLKYVFYVTSNHAQYVRTAAHVSKWRLYPRFML